MYFPKSVPVSIKSRSHPARVYHQQLNCEMAIDNTEKVIFDRAADDFVNFHWFHDASIQIAVSVSDLAFIV